MANMYLFCNNFVGTSVGNLSKRLKALSFTTCKKPKTNTFQLFLHAKETRMQTAKTSIFGFCKDAATSQAVTEDGKRTTEYIYQRKTSIFLRL